MSDSAGFELKWENQLQHSDQFYAIAFNFASAQLDVKGTQVMQRAIITGRSTMPKDRSNAHTAKERLHADSRPISPIPFTIFLASVQIPWSKTDRQIWGLWCTKAYGRQWAILLRRWNTTLTIHRNLNVYVFTGDWLIQCHLPPGSLGFRLVSDSCD
jgi:hypothetical protein